MFPKIRLSIAGLILFCTIASIGCATFNPRPIDEVPFREGAQTQSDNGVRVTVALPTAVESQEIFGIDLAAEHIQPVWLEIENRDKVPYLFVPHQLEAAYYSPAEAAYKSRFSFASSTNKRMEEHFQNLAIPRFISPGARVSGFALVSRELRTKLVKVVLLGPRDIKEFEFLVSLPDVKTDYSLVAFKKLYSEGEIVSLDEKSLEQALRELPCCCTNQEGTGLADPLNIVFIGEGKDVLAALRRSGWDETEPRSGGAVWRTIKAFFFGLRYKYSPFSDLYLYGRAQDGGFQKARETIHERNHLRLWLSPMRFEGKPVWVGQISRDVGIRYTLKSPTLVTHKIDPDVDETRGYLVYDLLASRSVAKIGFVSGVGAASRSEPRTNLTGDTYFTDGYRVVFMIADQATPVTDVITGVEFFDWEYPPPLDQFK